MVWFWNIQCLPTIIIFFGLLKNMVMPSITIIMSQPHGVLAIPRETDSGFINGEYWPLIWQGHGLDRLDDHQNIKWKISEYKDKWIKIY